MENLWKSVLEDNQITKLYEDINKHINYVIDHGMLHTLHVLEYVNTICDVFKVNNKTKVLSGIAALLHDAGRLQSRKEHAKYGAIYAKEYLQGKLSNEDIEEVCYAIEHHDRENFDYNTTNDVAWILIMADKMDYTRDRYIPELLEEKHKEKSSYNIKSICLKKLDNNTCKIEIELYKEIKNFKEEFVNMQIYKSVVNHFGCDLNIDVKIYKENANEKSFKS